MKRINISTDTAMFLIHVFRSMSSLEMVVWSGLAKNGYLQPVDIIRDDLQSKRLQW